MNVSLGNHILHIIFTHCIHFQNVEFVGNIQKLEFAALENECVKWLESFFSDAFLNNVFPWDLFVNDVVAQ